MMNEQQQALSLKAFALAIDKAKGQVALAQILNCSQARISRIARGESPCDGELAARIHRDVKVPKWDLRPDLFDRPKGTAKTSYAKGDVGGADKGDPTKAEYGRKLDRNFAALRKDVATLRKKEARAKSGRARVSSKTSR